MNGNKISNKINKVSKNSSQNTLKTVESETKTPKKIYILLAERQQVIEEIINFLKYAPKQPSKFKTKVK